VNSILNTQFMAVTNETYKLDRNLIWRYIVNESTFVFEVLFVCQ
jgi:hypothetical protein